MKHNSSVNPSERLPIIEGMCNGMFDGEPDEDGESMVKNQTGDARSLADTFEHVVAPDGSLYENGDDGPSG